MKKLQLIVCIFVLCANAILAQTPAGTKFCAAPRVSAAMQQQIKSALGANAIQRGTDLYVPVTLHIAGKNDGTGFMPAEQVLAAFCLLNQDFAPHHIYLYLADTIHYIRNTAWYDHNDFAGGDDMHQAEGVNGTLNTYVVNTAAGACGYAWYGGCIVLKNSCTGGGDHTWAHEAGHYFSLPHTFVGWEDTGFDASLPVPAYINGAEVEKLDGSNCTTAGDGLCDTPPDYISNRWTCANGTSGIVHDPNNEPFRIDGTYYMSYSNDACMNKFSVEQGDQMHAYATTQLANVVGTVPTPYQPTGTVANVLPTPNDTINTTNTAQLVWRRDPNATFYLLEVSLQLQFLTVQIRKTVTDTTYTLTGLQPNKRYNWRVRAMNEQFTCSTAATVATKFWTAPLVATDNATPIHIDFIATPNRIERGTPVRLQWNDFANQKATLRITNTAGQTVQTQQINQTESGELTIETANLAAGVYHIILQTEQGLAQCKLVVL